MGVGGRHTPAALTPGKTQHPLYWRLCGPDSWSGQVWNISHPQEFNSRDVQPVASCYTVSDIPTTSVHTF